MLLLRSLIVLGFCSIAGSAMAAVSREVWTLISDMKVDGALLAGAFLLVCIAISAVKILRKGT